MAWEIRKRRLNVDVETFSSVDLLKCGHHAYVRSPDFQIMLLAYGWDDEPVQIVDLTAGEQIPDDVAMAICHGTDGNGSTVECRAFNAAFELACFGQHFKCAIPTGHWRCTSVHALYCGLPNSLAKVSAALGLPADIGKANTGRALIRYFCIPCKPTKANGLRTRNLPIHNLEKWELFKSYCVQDVTAERAVKVRVEKIPFPEIEQRAWEMDQAINERGILIDQELARAAVEKGKVHRDRLLVEAARITGLSNPNSVKQLKEWLLEVEDLEDDEDWGRLISAKLDKKTILKLLAGLKNVLFGEQADTFSETDLGEFDLDDAKSVLRDLEARAETAWTLTEEEASALFRRLRLVKAVRVLQLRQEIGKASVKKYDAMLRAVCPDGRVRGIAQFYGANRTGRWAGKIVQTQNMRSNSIHGDELAAARHAIKHWTIEQAEFWFGDYSELLSQCVRTAIIAAPGKTFVACDFSAIEAVKLAWLANEEWRLEVFRTHGKIYEMSASLMFNVPLESLLAHKKKTGKHHPLRKRGKVSELACGFGGAVNGLINMGALDEGLLEEELQPMVNAWREKSPSIVQMWWDIDRAFKRCIYTHNPTPLPQYKISIFWEHGSVFIRLPSGRCLCYLGAAVENGDIVFWGVDQRTKQWMRQRTYGARLVENCIAEGTEVLTRRGWVAIEEIRGSDVVHDGVEFVKHGGLIFKSVQACVTIDGVNMTPDHEVLTNAGWKAASSNPEPYRPDLRHVDSAECGGEQRPQDSVARALHLRQPGCAGDSEVQTAQKLRLQDARADRRSELDARYVQAPGVRGVALDGGPLPTADAQSVGELRRSRDHSVPPMAEILHEFLGGHGSEVHERSGPGTRGQQQGVLEAELRLGHTPRQHNEQTEHDSRGGCGRIVGADRHRPDNAVLQTGPRVERSGVGAQAGLHKPVYDIADAGPRNRFVVRGVTGPFIVHNCTQASARDNLRDLMLSIENDLMDPWGDIVMHVHDEVVMEVDIAFAERLMRATLDKMKAPIRWAPGMPLKGAGYITPFYCKDE